MAQIVPLVGAAASTTGASRAFGTSGLRASDAQKESIASFMKDFASVKPSTMDNPSTPSDFMRTLKEMPTSIPDKLTLNFYMPHEVEFAGVEVEQVQIPATTGDFGVLPGHVPTVAQMRPGVVAVTKSSSEVHKYFVSSGFAFIHADSTTDIMAVEAVPVDQLNAEVVKKGLADYQAKLSNAKDDYERASAQIGIEVCSAMNHALGNV
uniref:ATP synthase F1 complex delta/epsilon subunit N-terminal domain-containing protein n=1 Tax=Mantoniella antarctica TaxID=81844 RepID=A0A7S0SFW2_9CHLO